MDHLSKLIALLLILCPCLLQAAEGETEDASTEQISEVVEPSVDFSDLAHCSEEDGQWYWTDKKQRIQLSDRTGSYIIAKTDIGIVKIKKGIFGEKDAQSYIGTLLNLVAIAKAANISSEEKAFIFGDSTITGPRLSRKTHIVVAEGVLAKTEEHNIDHKAHLQAIKTSAATLTDNLNNYKKIDRLGKESIKNILKRLDWLDSKEKKHDGVPPSFARRVVRHGWLQDVLGADEQTKALEQAVNEAASFKLLRLYTDGSSTLKYLSNAFNETVWVLQTANKTVYTCAAPKPDYHYDGKVFKDKVQLVVELPGTINPLDPNADLSNSNRLVLQDKKSKNILASWENNTFTADKTLWRSYLDTRGRNRISNFVPPHITQVTIFGDIVKIATPTGVLNALKDPSEATSEVFLENAKEVLTTPPYLDLMGQYMMTYVYDSPDSSIPNLIGNDEVSSDIHQTALQTLQTSCGGQFRGDCDDLSELYHNILERQGKIPHVVSLPAHAAVAWAEQIGEKWHTYVLQTGPALEFVDASLQKSLEKAYKHFDESDTFDPNGLGLLLRFSGENTRSSWRLSYRIFSEADYAKTMIDVQRDWHFQTYQRAIHKMLKMIEAGDEDTANFRELSGLYSFTGQYQKAAEYHQMAIERTPEATSRLYMGMELVQHLFEAEQNEKAIAAAQDIFDNQLPSLINELKGSDLPFALQMASTLTHDGAYDLSVDFLDHYAGKAIETHLGRIVNFVKSPQFSQRHWSGANQLRRLVKWYINTCLSVMEKRGFEDLEDNKKVFQILSHIEQWIQHIAAMEIEEPDDVLGIYAIIGNYYTLSMDINELITKVKSVDMPQNTKYEHKRRLAGIPQFAQDLPWIKMSVPFWWMQIAGQFEHNHSGKDVDKELIAECYTLAEQAYQHSHDLNIAGAFTRKQIHYARLVNALMKEDAKTIAELLRYVKEKDDKRLRDDTAQWIGDCAKSLSLEWYKKVIDIWVKELDYKPKYYWIAWRAALNKAPKHALIVAEIAAKRFKDDPAFVEEYQFMKELFE